MLNIERDAVKWEAYAGAQWIQQRELVVITHYLHNLGTQSMLICGFAFGALFGGMMELPDDADEVGSGASYMITLCICVGLMFFNIVASTLVASMGPQMALRGGGATSMRMALEFMKANRKVIVSSFTGGCIAFFVLVLQIGYHKRHVLIHHANSTILTILISCLLLFGILRCRRILQQFGGFTTSGGREDGDQFVSAQSYLDREQQATAHRPMSPKRRGASSNQLRSRLSFARLRPRSISGEVLRAAVRRGPHPADAKRKRRAKGPQHHTGTPAGAPEECTHTAPTSARAQQTGTPAGAPEECIHMAPATARAQHTGAPAGAPKDAVMKLSI